MQFERLKAGELLYALRQAPQILTVVEFQLLESREVVKQSAAVAFAVIDFQAGGSSRSVAEMAAGLYLLQGRYNLVAVLYYALTALWWAWFQPQPWTITYI